MSFKLIAGQLANATTIKLYTLRHLYASYSTGMNSNVNTTETSSMKVTRLLTEEKLRQEHANSHIELKDSMAMLQNKIKTIDKNIKALTRHIKALK